MNGVQTQPFRYRFIEAKISSISYFMKQTNLVKSVIEDSKGNAIRLEIANLFKFENNKLLDLSLALHRKLIIIEPWYKRLRDGFPGIHVDDPSQIIFDKDSKTVLKELECIQDPQQIGNQALSLKGQGNSLFSKKEYQQAIDVYYDALLLLINQEYFPTEEFVPLLDLPDNFVKKENVLQNQLELCVTLFNNISACYSSMDRYLRACVYAKCAYKLDPLNVKALYRMITALKNIGSLTQSIQILQYAIKLIELTYKNGNKAPPQTLEQDLKDLNDLLFSIYDKERKTHEDQHFYDILQKNGGHLKAENYIGKVNFVRHPEKGICCLARDDLKAGALIIIERPFHTAKFQQRQNFDFFSEIIWQISFNSNHSKIILDNIRCMYPRKNEQVWLTKDELADTVAIQRHEEQGKKMGLDFRDLCQIERVVSRNSIDIVDTSGYYLKCQNEVGLYFLYSLLNHACIPNVSLQYTIDAVIIRANKNISKNEEICISYLDYIEKSYAERKFYLIENYGFECNCEMCSFQQDQNQEYKQMDMEKIALRCKTNRKHLMYPTDITEAHSSYVCSDINCKSTISRQEAYELNKKYNEKLEKLYQKSGYFKDQQKREKLYQRCLKIEKKMNKHFGPNNYLFYKFNVYFCYLLNKHKVLEKRLELTEKVTNLMNFYQQRSNLTYNQILAVSTKQTFIEIKYYKEAVEFIKKLYYYHQLQFGGKIDEFSVRFKKAKIKIVRDYLKKIL